MSNSTFFKLGNGNFVLHGYDTERDLKRAERDVKRALAALAQGSVYEGDILSDGDDTYKVVFDEGVFRIENSHYTTGVYVAIHIDKIDEVIGNIHDNPELLEVGSNESA